MRPIGAVLGLLLLAGGGGAASAQGAQNRNDPPPARWYPPGQAAIPQPAPVTPAAGAQIPVVMNVRIGEHEDRTRFVVELSDPIKLRVFTLSNPDRVVIDMPQVLWRLQGPQRPSGNGAVKSYRYGLFRPGDSRFVIDLNMPVTTAEPMLLPPSDGYGYRVVVDLFRASQTNFDQSSGWPADLKALEAQAESRLAAIPPQAPKNTQRKVVVIDAGHGGIDSGTVGINGMQEKDLVLDEAKRLGRALARRGYTVHLTRDTDIFIPLRERVNIARGYGADLFISLHADSNPNPDVTGASVYTLSEKGSDKEAEALAKKENQSDIIAGVDLTGQDNSVSHILIDLAQRETMNRSSVFAETVVQQLSAATDVLPRTPHRSGALVVLKAPDVPAVLIELGYLSNIHDSTQMGGDTWRNGVANAIADAVDRHFGPATAGDSISAGANRPE